MALTVLHCALKCKCGVARCNGVVPRRLSFAESAIPFWKSFRAGQAPEPVHAPTNIRTVHPDRCAGASYRVVDAATVDDAFVP